MALILEDSAKVTKKQIPIPQNAKKVFKAMKKIYEPYLDKNLPGSKILKSLGGDKKYNQRGNNAKKNGQEIKQDSVNVNDAKVRLHRMDKLPKNSLQYQLNGGELAANIYRKGIERARGTKEVEMVKPPKPTSNAQVKPNDINTNVINVPNGKITYNSVANESKIINESIEDNKFYDYLEEYNATYVLESFMENPKGKQNWGVLINPNMYHKALKEFTKFGKLTNFPTRHIYQWMGIIMKNTAILYANTQLVGHTSYFPNEEFEQFMYDHFGDNRDIEVSYDGYVKIELSTDEVIELCNGQNPFVLNEDVSDKYGQLYFPWIDKSQAYDIARNDDLKRIMGKYKNIEPYIQKYNDENIGKIEIETNGKIYWNIDSCEYLYEIGLFDWMEMPDGSDAFSDYGIDPLFKIFKEYDDEMTPEKVLVLVNKALDVYHQRGDMASIFIQGGSKALTQIGENTNKRKHKIYITETQIAKLKHGK